MSGSILAYGQTGTGKTYTIIGNQDGILPMTVNYMLATNKDNSLSLSISAMQIYNEQVSDPLFRSLTYWYLKIYRAKHFLKTSKLSKC